MIDRVPEVAVADADADVVPPIGGDDVDGACAWPTPAGSIEPTHRPNAMESERRFLPASIGIPVRSVELLSCARLRASSSRGRRLRCWKVASSWTVPVASTVMLVAGAGAAGLPAGEQVAVRARAASPVPMVAVTAALSRLIATKPLSPREKAIASAPLSHQ